MTRQRSGKWGYFTFVAGGQALVLHLTDVELTEEAELLELTDMDDDDWRTFTLGIRQWSASGNFTLDDAVTIDDSGVSGTLTLCPWDPAKASAAPSYSGTAVLQTQTVRVDKRGEMTGSFTAQGNGALAKSPAPSPSEP
jgi:hypothetical protein